MGPHNVTPWPHDLTERLRELVADSRKLSAGEIAHLLGVPRNAVIGKVRRLGLKLPCKQYVRKHATPEAKREHEKAKRRLRRNLSSAVPAAPVVSDEITFAPLDTSRLCHLLDLKNDSCRWPIGEPSAKQFCGAVQKPNSSYCQHHHALAHTRTELTPEERALKRQLMLRAA